MPLSSWTRRPKASCPVMGRRARRRRQKRSKRRHRIVGRIGGAAGAAVGATAADDTMAEDRRRPEGRREQVLSHDGDRLFER